MYTCLNHRQPHGYCFPYVQTNYKKLLWLWGSYIFSEKHLCSETQRGLDTASFLKTSRLQVRCHSCRSWIGVNFPTEFLNWMNPCAVPHYTLRLKSGYTEMLLKNLEPRRLCNGTRLVVTTLRPHVVTATVLTECGKWGELLRILLTLSGTEIPCPLKRLQFPFDSVLQCWSVSSKAKSLPCLDSI